MSAGRARTVTACVHPTFASPTSSSPGNDRAASPASGRTGRPDQAAVSNTPNSLIASRTNATREVSGFWNRLALYTQGERTQALPILPPPARRGSDEVCLGDHRRDVIDVLIQQSGELDQRGGLVVARVSAQQLPTQLMRQRERGQQVSRRHAVDYLPHAAGRATSDQ